MALEARSTQPDKTMRRTDYSRLVAAAVILFLVVAAAPGLGIASADAAASPDSALQSVLRSMTGTPLSLHDAMRAALDSSTSVQDAKAAYHAARGALRSEAGAFDPELFFNWNHSDNQQPTSSFFSGANPLITKQTTTEGGLRVFSPIGTSLELALNTTRTETNSTLAFLNPEYDAFGSLSVRQPLLTGFASSARKRVVAAHQAAEAAKARYEQAVSEIAAETERTYWDLYAAERDYAVQQLTRDQADAFLKETQLRAQSGLVGPDQVATAQTFLAEQTLGLLEQDEQLGRQSDRLASLIGKRPVESAGRFIASDEPPHEFAVEPLDTILAKVSKSNLDLKAAAKDIAAAQTYARAAHWESLPQVDLVGSYGGNGLGGSPQDVIFGGDTLRTTTNGSISDALSQVSNRDFPSWSVGVQVTIPIGLRSGLGEKNRLDAEAQRAQVRYSSFERALSDRVRDAYRELAHGSGRLSAASDGVTAAQEQVRIGMIQFQNGRSTAFELVRLAADLAAAQQRYSAALVRTAKASATIRGLMADGSGLAAAE